MPDVGTQIQMLRTGSVDMVTEIGMNDVRYLSNFPDIETMQMKGTTQIVLYMRCDEPPFDDNRVRLALKYTIDPDELLRAAYGLLYDRVQADVSVEEHPIAPVYPEYTKLDARERDINRAHDLLVEAGYPDGVDIQLHYGSNYRIGPQVAIALQEMARPAGFRIELIGSPIDLYYSKYWLKVKFGITGWGNRVDPTALFDLAYKTGAPWNESHYSNPGLDKLVEEIASETNADKRKQLYEQVEELFKDDGGVVCMSIGRWHGLRKEVTGYTEGATFIGDWRYVTVEDTP